MSDDDLFGEQPQAALLAMEQLISGERSISEFRDELLNIVYESPSSVDGIRSMIDDYARRGLVPEQIHRLLVRDIDKITDEELPTTPTEFTFTSDLSTNAHEQTANALKQDGELPVTTKVKKPSKPGVSIGSLLRDRFEIVGRASGGSMGVVFKAIDRRLAEAEGGQPYVAIKVLAPDYAGHGGAMRALQQEATKGRYLNHPNIVRFLDLDRVGDDVFLVMEWLEGRPLSAILNERPGMPLPEERSWEIIKSLGDALQHAHDLGVTHADVKPGNVIIQPDGTLKLLDFGISRARGDIARKSSHVDSRILNAATPAYASPEVLSGEAARPVDDVFSLACVAYRLLSGQRVFQNKSALEARRENLQPIRIETLTGRRWSAMSDALALDAAKRTDSVSAFFDDLGVGDNAENKRWHPYALIAGCVALLMVLVVIAIQSVGSDRGPVELSVVPPAAIKEPDQQAEQKDAVPNSDISQGVDVTAATEKSVGSAPPEIAFSVIRADTVGEPANASVSLALPPVASGARAQEVSINLQEGNGVTELLLIRSEVSGERQLQFVRQYQDDATKRALEGRVSFGDSERVSFLEGQRSLSVRLSISDNDLLEPPLIANYALVERDTFEVLAMLALNISDDELRLIDSTVPADSLSFSQSLVEISEAEAAVRVVVWRLNPSAGSFDAGIITASGSAIIDEDFIAPFDSTLRFAAGEDRKMIVIPLVADGTTETAEEFELNLDVANSIEGLHTALTVRILDSQIDP